MTKLFYVARNGKDIKRVETYVEAMELESKGYRIKPIYRPINEFYNEEHPERKATLEYRTKNYVKLVGADGKIAWEKRNK